MGLFKKLSTLALGTTMILGLGLSLGLNNNVAVKAAEGDYSTDLQLVGLGVGVGWVTTANEDYQMIEQSDGTFQWTGAFSKERFRIVKAGSWTLGLDWDNVVATSEKVSDGTFVKASTKGTDKDNNIWCDVAGSYTLVVNSAKTTLSIISSSVTNVVVTEYAVLDGTREADPFTTEKAYENAAFVPTSTTRNGYTHGGWYTDEACTTSYTSAILTEDTTLYAKYTSLVDPIELYYTNSGWIDCYAYTYGGTGSLGSWPGVKISTSAFMTDGVTFCSTGAIYKTLLPSDTTDGHVIFSGHYVNDKSETVQAQTENLAITAGSCYFVDSTEDAIGDPDKGAAAKVVFDINAARKAVVAADPILAKSYCGVSAATATTLIDEYDALTETQKGYVDASTDYTYNHEDPTGDKVNVSFTAIIAQLRIIKANGSSSFGSLHNDSDTSTMLFIILGVAILGVTTAGYFYFSKKRKVSSK